MTESQRHKRLKEDGSLAVEARMLCSTGLNLHEVTVSWPHENVCTGSDLHHRLASRHTYACAAVLCQAKRAAHLWWFQISTTCEAVAKVFCERW